MSLKIRRAGIVLSLLVLVNAILPAQPVRAQNMLVVDDDGHATAVDCDSNQRAYSSIQAAVDAAMPGDMISVCPGTYDEQVAVATNDITLSGAGMGLTTIRPTTVTTNAIALRTGFPSVAVVLVDGVTDVRMQHLTVDGSAAVVPAECPPYFGIFYRNASGSVESVHVTGVLPCVSVGILAQSPVDGSGHAEVTINSSVVDQYGVAGIICNELGTNCTITNNTITGLGGYETWAQIGVQIGFRAVAAEISGNIISDHVYTGRGPDPVLDHFGTGILVGCFPPEISPDVVTWQQSNIFVNNDVNVWRTLGEQAGFCQ